MPRPQCGSARNASGIPAKETRRSDLDAVTPGPRLRRATGDTRWRDPERLRYDQLLSRILEPDLQAEGR